MTAHSIEFRYEVRPDDRETVRRLVQSTGVFSPVETNVAVELVDDRLERLGGTGGMVYISGCHWLRQCRFWELLRR